MKRAGVEPAGAKDPLGAIEKAAAAEEMLSVIRHDVRNRLATVRNAVYYIRRKLSGTEAAARDPRIDQFLETIDSEMVATNTMLEEGQSVGRLIGPGAKRASAEACAERAASLARVDGRAVWIDIDIEPSEIALHPEALALALRCLIENAAEAMPSGGVVTVRGAKEGAFYKFEVVDQGGGLPGDTADSAFQPFFTTKEGQLGLGLPAAARMARRVDGQLALRGDSGGTVATLTLPLAALGSADSRFDPGA